MIFSFIPYDADGRLKGGWWSLLWWLLTQPKRVRGAVEAYLECEEAYEKREKGNAKYIQNLCQRTLGHPLKFKVGGDSRWIPF
jgi:hypothetical protein